MEAAGFHGSGAEPRSRQISLLSTSLRLTPCARPDVVLSLPLRQTSMVRPFEGADRLPAAVWLSSGGLYGERCTCARIRGKSSIPKTKREVRYGETEHNIRSQKKGQTGHLEAEDAPPVLQKSKVKCDISA